MRSHPLVWITLLSALVFTTIGCGHRVPLPSPITAPPAPTDPSVSYQSTLSGSTFGNVSIDGSVGDGPPAFSNSATSPGGNLPATVANSLTGDEADRSCGTQGTNSNAVASASFTPESDTTLRVFGFGLNVDTAARGGFWRGKDVVICSGSNNTTGKASAKSTGEIRFVYNATPNTSDRIIIRTAPPPTTSKLTLPSTDGTVTIQNGKLVIKPVPGATITIPVTPISVFGPDGKPLDLNFMGENMIADLDLPGPYTVRASITTDASGGGGCQECAQKTHNDIQVSVQSMRDALSLGRADGIVNGDYQIPLPIFATLDLLQSTLENTFLDKNGRWYPCKSPDSGCTEASDVYLSNPKLSIEGAWVILRVHLDGHFGVPPFGIQVHTYGDIEAYGVPIVENNVIKLQNVQLNSSSDDFIFRYLSARFHDRLLSQLQSRAEYDLTPLLTKQENDLKKIFPFHWGSACIATNFNNVQLSSVIPQTTPAGITTNVKVGINIVDITQCKINTP